MGFLGALLGAAPTVLAGVAKGKRDREETEYTRDQAAMKQMAEENARQQAMAQAMQEFEVRQEDLRDSREARNKYQNDTLVQTKLIADERAAALVKAAEGMANLRRELAKRESGSGTGRFTLQQDTDGGFFRVNTATGEFAPLIGPDGKQVFGSGARPGSTERTNSGLSFLADEAINDIKGVEGRSDYSPPGAGEVLANEFRAIPLVGDLAANAFQSNNTEELFNAYLQLVIATQVVTSGKAMSNQEYRRIARSLMPTAGESAQSQAAKRAKLDERMAFFRQLSGRASTDQAAPSTKPGTAPADPPVKRPSPRSALGITPL